MKTLCAGKLSNWPAYDHEHGMAAEVRWPSAWNKRAGSCALGIPGILLMLFALASASAQTKTVRKLIEPKPNVAAASLASYLERVRADNSNIQAAPGSIWTDSGRFTRMVTDVRAMRPHDLISVVVSESLAASTDGTVKNSRGSNASSAISGLIGTLHAGNALQDLVNQTSASGLNAQGTSATNSSLSTTFGGQ
ncbi:MAG: flagellar basal body L-ring protein FlgH, partial [Edaphobacter sp.]